MYPKIAKVVLGMALCLSIAPLGGLGTVAWGEEGESGTLPAAGDGHSTAKETQEPAVADDGTNEAGSGTQDNGPSNGPGDSGPQEAAPELAGQGQQEGPSAEGEGLAPQAPTESGPSPSAAAPEAAAPCSVEYRAHVQNIGWQGWVADGATAGTTGRGLRMEALNIRLSGTGVKGSIEYRTHVQDIGWQGWVADGAQSGTTGQSLRTEAVSIRLTGDAAASYDVYYRAHVQDIGWMGWATDGQDAGTTGYGLRMEALEVRLVAKGGAAPGPAGDAFRKPPMALEAIAHVQDVGWMAWQDASRTTGTTGRALRLEALGIMVADPDMAGSVEYQAHVQDIGWQGWRRDGMTAGTTGRSLRVEALQVRLTGALADSYDVYYRVHCAGVGWLGWAKDSEVAGTTGFSLRVEAFQAVLVPKGGKAPGPTAVHTLEVSYASQADVAGKGWMAPVQGRATVGTTGQSRQMEAFKLTVSGNVPGGIEYSAHVQDIGWQGWVADGAVAGTEGEGRRVEAVRIRLTGGLASYFDVYYRAHSANFGWLGWAADGANAGTSKLGLRLEAFQVAIVPKGAPAPGKTSGAYKDTRGVVCIDAGHGAIPDATLEPIGPGSSVMQPREPGGTSGVTTGIPEYQVTLNVALKLQRDLEAQGITVVMVRTTNNVDISSRERAAVANNCNADLFIRLHCDGSTNPGVYGFTTLVPGYNGWTAPIYAESTKAAQVMHPLIIAQTGVKDDGIVERNDLAGFNYSHVPSLLFEMGYMSNAAEEQRLVSDAYQERLAQSISAATVAYLSQKG